MALGGELTPATARFLRLTVVFAFSYFYRKPSRGLVDREDDRRCVSFAIYTQFADGQFHLRIQMESLLYDGSAMIWVLVRTGERASVWVLCSHKTTRDRIRVRSGHTDLENRVSGMGRDAARHSAMPQILDGDEADRGVHFPKIKVVCV